MPLVARDLKCPVCSHGFKLHTPKSSASVLLRRDADFCPYYEGVNPLFYAIWVCPLCGFAALKDHFRELPDRDRPAVQAALEGAPEIKRHDFTKPERSLFAAMLSLQLALRCYEARHSPGEIRGGILLRLAWTCRYGNDRKRERGYLQEAINAYQAAFDKGLHASSAISEAHVAFLIGEMLRRTGQGQDAIPWFVRAIQSDTKQGETYRMAKDQLYEAKESIRFFEYLKAVPLLAPLSPDELALLSALTRNRTYVPGKTICQEGDPGDSMFIVMRGTARVSVGGQPVAMLAPSQVFGEMSLLSGQPRSATVVAEEAAELLEIDRVAFKTLFKANPAIAAEIASTMEARRETNARVLEDGEEPDLSLQTSPDADNEGGAPARGNESGLLARLRGLFELS
ncbi:Cyclic nucleotide-gated potassium channel [compost metagenome]